MDKIGDLVLVSKLDDNAIRSGIESEGFTKYDASCISIRERAGVFGSRVFNISLTFNHSIALDHKGEAYSDVDQLVYVGRKYAKELQLFMSRLLPNIRIGDKVILSIQEYKDLRKSRLLGQYPNRI